MVESSPTPMRGSRQFPSLVGESPSFGAYPNPPSGSRLNPTIIEESPTQIKEDECDQWFPLALEQGGDDEEEQSGVLEHRPLYHSPNSVASSPAPPEPMSGTRNRPMLVEESLAPDYIVVEDSPTPQYIVVEESLGPKRRRPRPPMSCRGISGAYRGPGRYFFSGAYEWHERSSIPGGRFAGGAEGEESLLGGRESGGGRFSNPLNKSGLSPLNYISYGGPSTAGIAQGGGGGQEVATGLKPVCASHLSTQSSTVVHGSPQCIVVEESLPPAPQPTPVDPIFPPLSPCHKAYIEQVHGIPHLIRPSHGGGRGGEHSSSGQAPAPVAPGLMPLFCPANVFMQNPLCYQQFALELT